MPSPLRSLVPALALLLAGALASCGSAPSSSSNASSPSGSSPGKGAGASISTPTRTAAPATMSVVGVRRGDVLNLRAEPTASSTVLRKLAPVAHGLVPTGRQKSRGTATWVQVRSGRVTGWVNAAYVAYLGKVTSHASRIATLDIAATRVGLARKTAAALGLGTPQTIAQVRHPVVILDALGAQDDSVLGSRLRVVLEYGEAGFQVQQVSTRAICPRGVTAEGLCL